MTARFSNRFSPVGHQHCADPHCLECLKAERDPHPAAVGRLQSVPADPAADFATKKMSTAARVWRRREESA